MSSIKKGSKSRFFRQSVLAIAITATVSGCSLLQSGGINSTLNQPTVRGSLQTTQIPYSKFQLDNGLTVIVHEDRKNPVVAVNVWYKVGSKDEQPGKTGFAHLFEHLMFNGSENHPGEYFVPLLSAGATDMNGTTNSDRTNYFATVPTSALDMTLWMESDRMGHFLGALSKETLDEQRGVVKNEKRQKENRPYGKSWEYIAQDTFPLGHPYSWTTIGSMADLDAATLDDVKTWFKTYYGPSNAVIVLAGDIDAKTAREKVSHYFADIPPGPPLSKQQSWVAKRSESKRRIIEDRVKQTRIVKIWNTPAAGNEADTDLQLLAYVLGNGKNSRLYKRLIQEDKVATRAEAWVYSRQLAGQFGITVDIKPDIDSDIVEKAITEEINKLLLNGPTRQELQQAKFRIMADFVMATERVGGFGGKSDILARGEVYHNDPGFYQTAESRLVQTTSTSLKETGNHWLNNGAYTQITQPYPSYSTSQTHADRSKLPTVGPVKTPLLPTLQKATLSNGMTVVVAERQHSPLISMRLQFNAGRASHQNYGEGIPAFILDMLQEGTTSRNAQEIQSELDSLGAELNTWVNSDVSAIDINTLSVSLVDTVELLQDLVMNPAFKESDIEHLRSQGLDQIAKENLEPNARLKRALPGILYGNNHPYSSPETGSGSNEALKTIKRQQLISYYHDWLRPDNATLIVTGDTDFKTLIPMLEQAFAHWQTPTTAKPSLEFPEAKQPEKAVVYLMDQPDAQQSTIVAAQLLPALSAFNTGDEMAFKILNDLFGGAFTSRINMNLREDKHWSYGARSYTTETQNQRLFRVQTSVQTDKTAAALVEIKKELKQIIRQEPPTINEVNNYRDNRLKKLAGRYETNSSLLNAVSKTVTYHQPDDYLQQYPSLVKKVTPEAVRKISKDRLKPEQMVWIVVGDLKAIEPEIKALNLGEIRIL